jgi:hypothetical protein
MSPPLYPDLPALQSAVRLALRAWHTAGTATSPSRPAET